MQPAEFASERTARTGGGSPRKPHERSLLHEVADQPLHDLLPVPDDLRDLRRRRREESALAEDVRDPQGELALAPRQLVPARNPRFLADRDEGAPLEKSLVLITEMVVLGIVLLDEPEALVAGIAISWNDRWRLLATSGLDVLGYELYHLE